MKNKKGFTLVELLAVIAILAILTIIVLPNVLKLFNDAKKNSFTTEVKQLYKSAKQAWIKDSFLETNEKIYSRCSDCVGEELDLTGRTNFDYYIRVDKQGVIKEFYVTDGTYQFTYEGDLFETYLNDVQEISNLNEDEVITINRTGASNSSSASLERTVCYFSEDSNSEVFYYKINTKNCLANQTLEECLGYSGTAYHYDEAFRTCINNAEVTIDSVCGYRAGWDNINSCYNSYANRQAILSTSLVSDYSGGCFLNRNYTTARECCLAADSEVVVYDKKKKKRVKKKLKDITYDDLLLVWDFDKCRYTYAKPIWIQTIKMSDKYYLLRFDDGSSLKVIGDHRIYNADKNEFVSVVKSKIGFTTINSENKIIKLVEKTLVNEPIEYTNVITDHHINVYANGILTSHGINNLYKIEKMKFIKEKNEVFTKEDLNDFDKELVSGLRLDEISCKYEGSKEKTKEELLKYINMLLSNKK